MDSWNNAQMVTDAGAGRQGRRDPELWRESRVSIYKRFLYLDTEQAVNALACIEGGAIEERSEKIFQEKGGDFGLSFALGSAKIELGGKGRKSVEEEVRRKRTAHSAIAELLVRLRTSGDLRRVDPNSERGLEENELIEFSGNIELWPPGPWPIERLPSGLRSDLKRLARREDTSIARRRDLGLPRSFTARLPMSSTRHVAIMPMHWQYVVARHASEFSRRVSVVGQVEVMPAVDERFGVAYLPPDWSYGVVVAKRDSHSGTRDELAWVPEHKGEWVMVHPLCIYK
jgi:hypothetical protein